MSNTVKIRSGTTAELVSLGALEAGELGYATDTDKVYVGDGATVGNYGFVMDALFDAQSILAATTDNTPAKLTVGEQTIVGRITGGNIAALTVAQLQTLILSADLPENVTIRLDPILSADTKWTGITRDVTAGTTGLVYGYCYYCASTGKWELTNATAIATCHGEVGMCVKAAATDTTGTLLMDGLIRADDEFDTFTVGSDIYLSAATPGKLTATAPTGTTDFVVRIVASAPTADSVSFKGDNAYAEITTDNVLVTKAGTPVDNQIGVWTGDGTIEGDTKLTWDAAILTVTGNIGVDGATVLLDGSTSVRNMSAAFVSLESPANRFGLNSTEYMQIATTVTSGITAITHTGSAPTVTWTAPSFDFVGSMALDAVTVSDVLTFSDGGTIDDTDATTITITQTNIALTGILAVTGATTITGALTVGASDTGHDVTFWGATADYKMLWDESADALVMAGSTIFIKEAADAKADVEAYGQYWVNTATPNTPCFTDDAGNDAELHTRYIEYRVLDKDTDTAIADGVGGEFRCPQAMTVLDVGAYVDTAGTGSVETYDIEEGGATILTTLITIDDGGKSSEAATTPPVIGGAGPVIAADAIITFNIDGIGSSSAAKGLTIWMKVLLTPA